MMNSLKINDLLEIPVSEVHFQFGRAGGPGGQNVNKVETRVELYFDVGHSPALTEEQRVLLIQSLGSKIDRGGYLRIVSRESRSQWKNREHATNKFIALLAKALTPKKKRRKTKRPAAAVESRLENKKRRGELKRQRGKHPS